MPSSAAPQLFGVRELYRPANSVPEVDIVAVHGLNGDRLRTWTTQSGPSPVCWLSHPDFLPRYLPQARVLTYGYNANISSLGSKIAGSERLLQHAQTLVAQLTADRELDDASQRPIIFVCHSLGGIVVKKALVYSASRASAQVAHLQSVYTCTYAILFLGTPHHGSSKARILHTMTNLASLVLPSAAVSLSTTLLRTLESESEALQEATAAFVPLMSRFCVFFFWEQHKTDLKYKRDYIVDEPSAAPMIDNTERCGIAADHREMCRFGSTDDQGFRTVVEALKRYARTAPDVVAERCRRAREALDDEMNWRMAEMRSLSLPNGISKTISQERGVGTSKQQDTVSREIEVEAPKRSQSLVIKPQWQGE
ncbi:ribonuclease p/mrp subunit [Cadophora sp. MPI-SDFR-AT-0126]|nr:ribonuclease p/mrp subunit [Leotiomycetes sp. MPI-SDFR-AT-0126]